MKPTKTGTVALVVRIDGSQPVLVEKFSDDREIAVLEGALATGENSPLELIYSMREKQTKEDEEFGNYVEELLSQPFIRPEIQEHGLQWLKSKIRIEEYQRCEAEATRIIAEYAFQLYVGNPNRTDFFLAGPVSKVRVRVFPLPLSISQAA